ncbi:MULTISPECIES: ABC transporter permease [Aphanothece]|uniref:ABC transporter permease n=1 Tax=Aphanothece TaxID=1121 RepID=UPI00398506CC
MLRRILQELAETAPLALLVGAAIGVAMVGLLTGTVGESSNESLEVLVLGSLQVVTPLGVSLIWICRCAPLRLAVAVRRHLNPTPRPTQASDSWRCQGAEVAGAACSALLLVPWFEMGLLLGGLLASPRAGLGFSSELQELTHLMPVSDLLRCFLRTAVFTAAAQWVCLRKAAQVKGTEGELARLLADALPQSLLVVMGLEVIWLTLLVPLHGTYA